MPELAPAPRYTEDMNGLCILNEEENLNGLCCFFVGEFFCRAWFIKGDPESLCGVSNKVKLH